MTAAGAGKVWITKQSNRVIGGNSSVFAEEKEDILSRIINISSKFNNIDLNSFNVMY